MKIEHWSDPEQKQNIVTSTTRTIKTYIVIITTTKTYSDWLLFSKKKTYKKL